MAKIRVATNWVGRLYAFIVLGNQKAIIGFVLAFIGSLGLQVGGVNILDATVGELVNSGVNGLITLIGVYFKTNKY